VGGPISVPRAGAVERSLVFGDQPAAEAAEKWLRAGKGRGGDAVMKRPTGPAVSVVCAALLLATLAAARSQPATVRVTAGKPAELRFTLSRKSVPKGAVRFRVTNRYKLRHDFKIAGKKTRLLPPR
jgi:hypothetical protein